MRHRYSATLLALLLIFLAGCGPSQSQTETATPTTPANAETTATPGAISTIVPLTNVTPQLPQTVKDKDGNEVTVTDVSKIVTLNGDVTEIVWTLGLGKNIVGTDTSSTYPTEVKSLPKIGYQRQLAAEGILSLKPTVIIGSESAGPPETLTHLRSAGVPVVIIQDPPTLASPALKLRAIAAAVGLAAEGERLATQVQQQIDTAQALAKKATTTPKVLFLYVRGSSTQSVAGVGTQADAMIAAAGGTNSASAAGINGYKPLTAEVLAAAQPDYLILLSAGLQSIGGVDGLLKIPGVAATPAGQKRAILDYDDLYFLGMTPRAGQALHELVQGIHPELK